MRNASSCSSVLGVPNSSNAIRWHASLMQFVGMETTNYSPNCNIPPHDVQQGDGYKKLYFNSNEQVCQLLSNT